MNTTDYIRFNHFFLGKNKTCFPVRGNAYWIVIQCYLKKWRYKSELHKTAMEIIEPKNFTTWRIHFTDTHRHGQTDIRTA
jgi:hypothetical protein